MRHWIKHSTKSETFPQVFVNGEFIGGLDKIRNVVESGEFAKMIPQGCKKSSC